MENQKVIVNLPEGFNQKSFDLVIREGVAPRQLDAVTPNNIEIEGSIGSISKYVSHLLDCGIFDKSDSYVMVDRDNLRMSIFINASNPRHLSVVNSYVELSKDLQSLLIVDGGLFEPKVLSDLFKKKRAWFEDRGLNMLVVNNLKNLKAKVNQSMEDSKDDKSGNSKTSLETILDTSLIKDEFVLKLPIFKGMESKSFCVEIYPELRNGAILVYLDSPSLFELIDDEVKRCFDAEIEAIKSLVSIPIIEK